MLSPWEVLEIIVTKDLNIAQYAHMILFSANNINMHIYIQKDIDIWEMQLQVYYFWIYKCNTSERH